MDVHPCSKKCGMHYHIECLQAALHPFAAKLPVRSTSDARRTVAPSAPDSAAEEDAREAHDAEDDEDTERERVDDAGSTDGMARDMDDKMRGAIVAEWSGAIVPVCDDGHQASAPTSEEASASEANCSACPSELLHDRSERKGRRKKPLVVWKDLICPRHYCASCKRKESQAVRQLVCGGVCHRIYRSILVWR